MAVGFDHGRRELSPEDCLWLKGSCAVEPGVSTDVNEAIALG